MKQAHWYTIGFLFYMICIGFYIFFSPDKFLAIGFALVALPLWFIWSEIKYSNTITKNTNDIFKNWLKIK